MPDLIAVNIPKDVDRYFKETKEGNPDYTDAQAWATAWSRFCKYKNPGSDHCQQPASAYFPGKGGEVGSSGPLMLRRDYGSTKQASSFDAPAAIRMMRQMRKGKRVNFDKGMAHRFGGTTYEKMEDGPDGRWVMASGMTGNIPFGWEDHPEWLQTPEEVVQREAKHSFGVSETWKHATVKRVVARYLGSKGRG